MSTWNFPDRNLVLANDLVELRLADAVRDSEALFAEASFDANQGDIFHYSLGTGPFHQLGEFAQYLTRKLANQGVSTFKYRPEEGRLLLVAERLPKPTYTAPRVRQGFRVAEDVHCIRRTTAGAEISEIGKAALEAHHV